MTSLIRLSLPIALLAVFSLGLASGQEKKADGPNKDSVWMKKKREFAQNILAGLTEADFAKIRTNAQDMNTISILEKWAVRGDQAEYKRQVASFDSANQDLIRQAKAKNLEGVTLAYNQLIVSCVRCHQIVRDAKK